MSSTALKPIDEIRGTLDRLTPEFKAALPPHVPPERFIRIAKTAIISNPDIANCEKNSIYGALMKCAQDGLLPDGREAAIVKYGNLAQYTPMVGGICKKARNSGEILDIDALVVYSNDQYDAWVDEKGQHFKHVKARGERGEPLLTYAYARTKEGGFFFEEIDEPQMADIEAMSRAKTGPWKGDFRDEMKRKSAIRRLAKYRLPSSTDLSEVIRRDDHLFETEKPETKAPEVTRPNRLSQIVEDSIPDDEKLPFEKTGLTEPYDAESA